MATTIGDTPPLPANLEGVDADREDHRGVDHAQHLLHHHHADCIDAVGRYVAKANLPAARGK